MSTKDDKINEKNTNRTKFNTDNTNTTTNFNERTTNIDYNNTLNQQQDAINKTLDSTLHNVKEQPMKLHEKFHDTHNVLLNIKNKLFKL